LSAPHGGFSKTNKPIWQLWSGARKRAEEKGLDFNLTFEDIVIPDVCPMLGIPLVRAKGRVRSHSPTLDRIIPRKGYVRGNIQVISHRANTIKTDATAEELRLVADYMEKLVSLTSPEAVA